MPRRTRLQKAKQILEERLRGGVCNLWPYCGCHETLEQWAENLSDGERIFPMEQLDWAQTTIFISLCCMAKYCPDLGMRVYAMGQLQDKFWDEQKMLSVHGWQ